MAQKKRIYRVGEQVQSALAKHLIRMSDPRFYLVTISSVVVSRDLKYAKIYWTSMSDKQGKEDTQSAFESATGSFRGMLAKTLGLRVAPRLKFFYDDTLETQNKVFSLFQKLEEQEKEKKEYDDTP